MVSPRSAAFHVVLSTEYWTCPLTLPTHHVPSPARAEHARNVNTKAEMSTRYIFASKQLGALLQAPLKIVLSLKCKCPLISWRMNDSGPAQKAGFTQTFRSGAWDWRRRRRRGKGLPWRTGRVAAFCDCAFTRRTQGPSGVEVALLAGLREIVLRPTFWTQTSAA